MKDEAKPSRITVRKARASDREAVFDFCRKTWSWGDYIQKVWDSWFKDEEGRVFVATLNDMPVGMSYLSIDKPHEAWLRGARTDPRFRRMGIAEAITKRCLQHADEKDVRIVRLVTGSDNVAAQSLLKKLGFKPVAEFAEAECRSLASEASSGSRWATDADLENLWKYLQSSVVYRQSAGLYTVLFHWFSLEKKDLARFVKQQKAVIHVGAKDRFDGLILIDDGTATAWRKNTRQTCYVDGTHDSVIDMTRFLKAYCRKLGVKKLYGFTYNHKPLTVAFEALGFKLPETMEIVYEKPITKTIRRRRPH